MKLIATNCALLLMVLVASSVSVIMQQPMVAEARATKEVTGVAAAAAVAVARKPKKVVFESVTFDADPEWVVIEAEITKVEEQTAVNIQVNIKKSIPQDSLIDIELTKEMDKGEFNPLIKSGKVAVCDLLRNATNQPLFHPIVDTLAKFTNLPLQCPLPVGEFWIKGFVVDAKMIPDFVPMGRYKVNVAVMQPNQKVVYTTEWILSIEESGQFATHFGGIPNSTILCVK